MEEKIRLSEAEVDQKVEEIKERIKQNTLKQVKIGNSVFTTQQILEHKNKKSKNRKHVKLQKVSRKKNRK